MPRSAASVSADLKRLHTESKESVAFFDPNMSARERKKLAAAMTMFGGRTVIATAEQPLSPISAKKRKFELGEVEDAAGGRQSLGLEKLIGDKQLQIVEEILDKRLLDNKPIYLVRWKDFDPSWDSWEPADHIFCSQVIDHFEAEWAKVEEAPEKASTSKRKTKTSTAKKKKGTKPETPDTPSSTTDGTADSAPPPAVKPGANFCKGCKKNTSATKFECYVCEQVFGCAACKKNLAKADEDYYCADCE